MPKFEQRPQCQIQIAHDIIHAVLAGEIDIRFDEDGMRALHAAHDCIGWVLGFECGEAFQENLRVIMTMAQLQGYKLVVKGDDHV